MDFIMYQIPNDLPLSNVIEEFTTQICVGQFDLQFTFGKIIFVVESEIDLVQDGELIESWVGGKWPDPNFYEVMNVNIIKYDIPNDRLIVIYFENGIEMHLKDDSDQYECMQISIEGTTDLWVI
jgi:hypothetical protein